MAQWRVIGCAVDFSETSRRAMRVAAEQAQKEGAALHLLHVYQIPGISFPEATVYSGQRALDQLVASIEKGLSEWKTEAESLGANNVAIHSVMGSPYAEILRFAQEQQCDLLVLGTHGRTAILRALMGSVAEKVVRHAPCPVLTVRPGAVHAEVGAENVT